MGDQLRGKFNDPRSGDVGDDHIEGAFYLVQPGECRFQPIAHSVDTSVAPRGFDRIGLHVDRHHTRGVELEGAEPQNPAPATDVEDPLTTGDPLHQRFDHLACGGMVTASESSRSELDQPDETVAIVFRPCWTDTQPSTEHDRAGVTEPCLQGSPAIGPHHRHHTLSLKRRDNVRGIPLVVHCGQYHPACVAGFHNIQRSHTEASKPFTHPGKFVRAGRHHNHSTTMPDATTCRGIGGPLPVRAQEPDYPVGTGISAIPPPAGEPGRSAESSVGDPSAVATNLLALQQVIDVVVLVAVFSRRLQLDRGERIAKRANPKLATWVSMWPAWASSDRLPVTKLPTISATMSSAVRAKAVRRLRLDASRISSC